MSSFVGHASPSPASSSASSQMPSRSENSRLQSTSRKCYEIVKNVLKSPAFQIAVIGIILGALAIKFDNQLLALSSISFLSVAVILACHSKKTSVPSTPSQNRLTEVPVDGRITQESGTSMPDPQKKNPYCRKRNGTFSEDMHDYAFLPLEVQCF